MKKQRYKILGSLLLIGAIVASIGITISFGNTKTVLTDNEMSNIVGGLDCHYCGSNGDGCASSDSAGDCETPDCDGWQKTSCLQAQQKCKKDDTTATCANSSPECTGNYTLYTCKKVTVTGGDDYCEWDSQLFECGGHKTGC